MRKQIFELRGAQGRLPLAGGATVGQTMVNQAMGRCGHGEHSRQKTLGAGRNAALVGAQRDERGGSVVGRKGDVRMNPLSIYSRGGVSRGFMLPSMLDWVLGVASLAAWVWVLDLVRG
jgi:hypothetical protein